MIPGSAFEDSFPYARSDDRKDNTRTSKRKGEGEGGEQLNKKLNPKQR